MEIPCVPPYALSNYAKVRMIDIESSNHGGTYELRLHNIIEWGGFNGEL